MVTKNPNNFDEALIQDAIFRGMFMMEDFWNKDKKYITIRIATLPTPSLIDLTLFATSIMASNLPDGTEERSNAIALHYAACHYINEPSEDKGGIYDYLPLFREATTAYINSIANASDDERAAIALRFMGFSSDTVEDVMTAQKEGRPEGIRMALDNDPILDGFQIEEEICSETEWDNYKDAYKDHIVDPTQEEDFSPLPCGSRPLLPPRLDVENASHWILQYFIRAYAEVLNLIRKRYGYVRRQQLLAAVLQIVEYYIENGYPVEQIPGILARTVLDWDEMCKTRGETQDETSEES